MASCTSNCCNCYPLVLLPPLLLLPATHHDKQQLLLLLYSQDPSTLNPKAKPNTPIEPFILSLKPLIPVMREPSRRPRSNRSRPASPSRDPNMEWAGCGVQGPWGVEQGFGRALGGLRVFALAFGEGLGLSI